ncbi:MAG TPA: hypothetical protein VGI10_04015 [Polyangiaceae bacterium]|jgi:hypothetical protein
MRGRLVGVGLALGFALRAARAGAEPPPEHVARVHFASEPDGITLHVQEQGESDNGRKTKDYRLLCTAPCDTKLPAGIQTLALAGDDGVAIPAKAVSLPEGPTQVRGCFESRAAVRYVGVLVALASIGTGVYFIISSNNTTTDCSSGVCNGGLHKDNTLLGILIGLAGGGGGILMARVPDVPIVQVASHARLPSAAHAITFSGHF